MCVRQIGYGTGLDITRVLGNLIDNAVEAVETLSNVRDKWVKVKVEDKGPFLSFTIENPLKSSVELSEKSFEPGITTKGDKHCGLGLYICQTIAKKLHGRVNISKVSETLVRFSLVVPKL